MSKYQIYICEDFLNNATRNDDELFWEYGNESLRILSASLSREISKAGSLELQIPYNHPFVSKIHKKRTRFSVFRDGDPIWSGRVLSTKKTFYKAIEIVVEGALTYFLDILQRPYDYDDIAKFAQKEIGVTSTVPTVEWHLKYLINEYNFRCQTIINDINLTPYSKRFNLEILAVDDKEKEALDKRSVNKKFISDEYSTVSDELSEEIQQRRGGFFLVKYRKEKDDIGGKNPTYKNTLVYCMHEEGITMNNPQTIEFGKNLLDFEDNEESSDIYTRCIPLGVTYDDIEKLRKKMYEKLKEKKDDEIAANKKAVSEYNKGVSERNNSTTERKQAQKTAAEQQLKQAQDSSGYTEYREKMNSYTKSMRAYEGLSSEDAAAKFEELKAAYQRGDIDWNPVAPGSSKPEEVKAPTNDYGETLSLKDYGYDSDSSSYTKEERITYDGPEKFPTWDESGYAMPESVDGSTRVLRGTVVNLWYLSPWKATVKMVDDKKKPIYDYVQNENSDGDQDDNMYDIERYGISEQAVEFDNVRLPTYQEYRDNITNATKAAKYFAEYKKNLDEAARKWLKKNKMLTSSITVNAIDLADMGVNVDHLDPGYSIPVKSKPHGLSKKGIDLFCSAVSLDLLNPGSSTYTIGAVMQSLTEKSARNKKQSGKAYGLARDSYSM